MLTIPLKRPTEFLLWQLSAGILHVMNAMNPQTPYVYCWVPHSWRGKFFPCYIALTPPTYSIGHTRIQVGNKTYEAVLFRLGNYLFVDSSRSHKHGCFGIFWRFFLCHFYWLCCFWLQWFLFYLFFFLFFCRLFLHL